MKVNVTQSCPTLCDLVEYIVHGILQARILEWVGFPFPPALQVDSLPAEPKNTGVGSLSLPLWLFLTQESNGDLCMQADSLPTELSGKPR